MHLLSVLHKVTMIFYFISSWLLSFCSIILWYSQNWSRL